MTCTLDPSFMPVQEFVKVGRGKPSETVLRVWDTDLKAWRSFVLENVKSAKVVE